jgi:hypothetical protein
MAQTDMAKTDTAQTDYARTKSAARISSGVFAVSPPARHRSGGARQALPCATCSKCFFGKSCHAPPGLFLMAMVDPPHEQTLGCCHPRTAPSAAAPLHPGLRSPGSLTTGPARKEPLPLSPSPARPVPSYGTVPRKARRTDTGKVYGQGCGAWIRFFAGLYPHCRPGLEESVPYPIRGTCLSGLGPGSEAGTARPFSTLRRHPMA